MIWRKLTSEEQSLLLALLSHIDQLGNGPDTELTIHGSSFLADTQTKRRRDTGPSALPSQPHADGETYPESGYDLRIVGKEDYAGVPFSWHTLELLVEYGFMHKSSSNVSNYRVLQDAWEYRDWQRLPRLRRWLKAEWAMSRSEVRAAVISGVVSLIVSVIVSVIVKLL